MKRLSLFVILFFASLPALAQTLTCPAAQNVTLTCAGTITPPAPVPIPTPPPAPSGCTTTYPFGSGDNNWNKLVVGGYPFPSQAAVGSGVVGGSISFTTDQWNTKAFPEGIVFQVLDDTGQVGKEITVSKCPHNFTEPVPVAGQLVGQKTCQNIGGISYQGIQFKFPSQKPAGQNDCILEANTTYYFNFRAVDQSTTQLQLVGQQRQSPIPFF